jgi:hypothetical protein
MTERGFARYPQDVHTYLIMQHGFEMPTAAEGSPGLPLLDAVFEITREIIRDRDRLVAGIRHARDELSYVAKSLNHGMGHSGKPALLYEPLVGAPESTTREQVRQIAERERHLNTLCRAIEALPAYTWSVNA